MQKTKTKTIKQRVSKPIGCIYPGCPSKVDTVLNLPVGEVNETGMIVFPKGEQTMAQCKLCKYHAKIAESKLIHLVNQMGLIRLVGPYEIIAIAEKIFEIKESFKGKK